MLVAVFLFRKIMSSTWEGIEEKSKPNLKLDGKKLIVKRIGCYHYDKKSNTSFSYIEEVVYHFDNEDMAMEYYYKMR